MNPQMPTTEPERQPAVLHLINTDIEHIPSSIDVPGIALAEWMVSSVDLVALNQSLARHAAFDLYITEHPILEEQA